MRKLKLQSAIEYITTYGWALLLLGVALAAIAYFGFLSPQSTAGATCFVSQVFTCANPRLSESGLLTVQLQQVRYSAVNITAIGCSSNSTNTHLHTLATANQINMQSGIRYNVTLQCYGTSGSFSGGLASTFTGHIYLNYVDTSTNFPYSTSGTVFGKVSFVSSTSTTSTTTSLASSSTLSSSSSTLSSSSSTLSSSTLSSSTLSSSSSTLSSSTLSSSTLSSSTLSSTTTTVFVYLGEYTYGYTGGSQTFTAPSLSIYIIVKTWAAGGGDIEGYYYAGAGGFAQGTLSASPGQAFTINVGGGGASDQDGAGGGWPDGGGGCGYSCGGGGGGSTNVYRSGELVGAGGGGGADGITPSSGEPGGQSIGGGGGGGGGANGAGGTSGSNGFVGATSTTSWTQTGFPSTPYSSDPYYPGGCIGAGGGDCIHDGSPGYVVILVYGS